LSCEKTVRFLQEALTSLTTQSPPTLTGRRAFDLIGRVGIFDFGFVLDFASALAKGAVKFGIFDFGLWVFAHYTKKPGSV